MHYVNSIIRRWPKDVNLFVPYPNFFFQACGGTVDVAFVVDTSGSVKEHFGTIKSFVKKFIDGFDIAENKSHVAMVRFSNNAEVQFGFADEYNADTLKEFVDIAEHDGGQTYIDKAFDIANTQVFTRKDGWRPDVYSVSIQ